MRKTPRRILAVMISVLSILPICLSGQQAAVTADDDVQWDGVSHVGWQDRRPLCPRANEAFTVRFQAYKNDLSNARVRLDDGGTVTWITALVTGGRGPYSIWEASIPATTSSVISYYIELTDGSDTDYISVSGMSDGVPVDGGWQLDFATLEHAPAGATLCTGGAVFKVWAPGASTCHVRGGFNLWGTGDPMDRVGEFFIGFVAGVSAGDEYKYFFGPGDIWKPDARGRAFNPGSNYNTFVLDPFAYTWTVDDFDTPDLEEMVIYQLHVGQFSGRNDPYGAASHPATYADVAERVSHLVELGVNAVMVNPVTEFPTDLSWGYNPVTAWAPEWAYGPADDLKYMVDVLHQNGIAVLLDIVWNHFSYSDNFLWYYDGTQHYFDDPAADTPWGSQADFDDAEVRDYFLGSALHWLEEYRIDGFRMDATSYMTIQAGGWSLMQEFNDLVDRRYSGKVVIAEHLPDDDWVTRPTSIGGAGFDSQYYDYFTDTMRQEIFDAAFGDPEMWKIRNIINGGGTYLSGAKVLNYIELHDEAAPSNGGERIVKTIDTTAPHDDQYARGRVRLGQGIITMAPGVPAFLMGLDWLEDTGFSSDYADRIDWSKKTTYAGHFAFFSDMISLRSETAFRADASHFVSHINEPGNVIGFRRWDDAGDFMVIANFSNSGYNGYRIGAPQAGDWVEVLNSQDPAYGEAGPVNADTLVTEAVANDSYGQSLVLDIAPMAFIVLRKADIQTGTGEPVPDARSGRIESISPNPFNPSTTIRFRTTREGRVRLTIFDVSGRSVRTLVDRTLTEGVHEVRWDGRNDEGRTAASGVYFLRMEAGGDSDSRRLVLLR
ncbi:MAG TPA: alpha-amylase family glycosyl hydrolase [Candidatus Krumholzibacterium sp.]|nr:alpha-amylase family glycosyl hydrolase [Candidatus Krumholzibacterium sp.]